MSAVPPPPATETEPTKEATTETKSASLWDTLTVGLSGTAIVALAVFPIVFAILFHAGAAYLSYQKYQSGLWALVDFFFAVFYYPYYAFFLASAPPPQQGILMGGRRRR
jgi:membrane protein implicated in regulation of membrane protease activity